MLKNYSVDYDLRAPGRDYKSLIDALESYRTHWHCLKSKWIIRTEETAAQVRDKLVRHVDSNDALIVTRLAGEAAWFGLPDTGGAWLKNLLEAA